jgi:hypothetical protein
MMEVSFTPPIPWPAPVSSWTGYQVRIIDKKMDEEKKKSYSSHIVSFLSLLSDSHGPTPKT